MSEDWKELKELQITEGSSNVSEQLNSTFDGMHPLFLCLENSNLELAVRLIEDGAEINSRDQRGRTVLFRTIELENKQFFTLLIDKGCDVNASDIDGITPLHLASATPAGEFYVKTLLEKGAKVDAISRDGKTPLHCSLNFPNNLQLLLNYRPNTRLKEYEDLIETVVDSMEVIVNNLLDYGFSVPEERITDDDFLCKAVKAKQDKLVEFLLERNANPNAMCGHDTVLEFASENGFRHIVKMLMNNGASISLSEFAIENALRCDHHEIVVDLLEAGYERDVSYLLYKALDHESIKVFETFLTYERPFFNVNSTMGGRTMTYIAAQFNDVKAIRKLWDLGADLDYLGGKSSCPLHTGCRFRSASAVDTLLKLGADVNALSLDKLYPAQMMEPWHKYTPKIIRRHISMLLSAGLFVSEWNLEFLSQERDEELLAELEAEVRSMKTSFISETNISFYKVLTSSESDLANYAENPSVTQELDENNCTRRFKHYADYIQTKIKTGLRRKAIVDEFKEKICSEIKFFARLPSTCIYHVVSFLSTEDLRIMTGFCKKREDLEWYEEDFDSLPI